MFRVLRVSVSFFLAVGFCGVRMSGPVLAVSNLRGVGMGFESFLGFTVFGGLEKAPELGKLGFWCSRCVGVKAPSYLRTSKV